MGILVAEREFLGEIGLLDEGMKVYGGENVELGIRVSKHKNSNLNITSDNRVYVSTDVY